MKRKGLRMQVKIVLDAAGIEDVDRIMDIIIAQKEY